MLQLIVGLGNPGDRYKNTRHNLGFVLLDSLGASFAFEKKFKAETGAAKIGAHSIPCLKPQTYMNLSGESMAAYVRFYQCDPAQCLVIHDEIDLPVGEARLKFGGGEGGHNGLKSISESLGTRDYPRLRLGVGKPEEGNLIAIEDWVLSRFRAEEVNPISEMISRSSEVIRSIIEIGFPKAQSLFNGKGL